LLTEIHQFKLPETTVFGWGAAERVGEYAVKFGRRALLVTGKTTTKTSGLQEHISDLLQNCGLQVTIFDDVDPEPLAQKVEAGAAVARRANCDVVIGVGGGSPLDVGKGIAGYLGLEGSFLDYLRGKEINRPGLPYLALPTTSGTAAEITKNAVFYDEERKVKIGMRSDFWFPKVALVDPALTLSMPPALTAASGMDALSHALESYVSLRAHAASEALSAKAMTLIGRSIRLAFQDGGNRQAREDMAMASMIAGMAFANVGCGADHALAHVVGPAFGLSHGQACALLLPYVLNFNLSSCPQKAKEIAHFLTGRPLDKLKPEDGVAALFDLLRDLQLPSRLADLGKEKSLLPSLMPGVMLSGALLTNPRCASQEELLAILQQAYQGLK